MKNNYLKSVFWDYPQFQDERYLKNMLLGNNSSSSEWILYRFLEHARVVDTFKFFDINEIKRNIVKLKLKQETRKKWDRLIQVYAED